MKQQKKAMTLIQDQWRSFFKEKLVPSHKDVTLPGQSIKLLDSLTPEQLAILANRRRALNAGRSFTPRGYRDFFFAIYGWELPEHVGIWVNAFFEEWDKPSMIRGLMLEGFRGSTKSTAVVALAMFITGHNPHRSGLIICKNETEARLMGKYMADLVEFNPGWKLCFPTLVPDTDRGWSVEGGFHVKKIISWNDRQGIFLKS